VRRYGATYDHSTQLAIIDREEQLRRLIAHDTDAETIARAIAELL
jgi:cytochrome oxidase Cu insertion factor (SCO1/SenC/PrrC family)